MKSYGAEFAGTFLLVLFGTGSIVLDQNGIIPMGNLGIAAVFGLAVFLLILLFGKRSGAHINPAVSLGLVVSGNLNKNLLYGYWIVQFTGAICASLLLKILFPSEAFYGDTLPRAGIWQSAGLEFAMSFILMLLILFLIGRKQKLSSIASLVGLLIFLEAYFGGPLTGASMNPARSLGPALLSGELEQVWIYLLFTSLGTLSAALLWKKIN